MGRRELLLTAIGIILLTLVLTGSQIRFIGSDLMLRGNELSHCSLLHSVVFYHALQTNLYPAGPGDHSVIDGKVYSNKPPGLAFLVTPAYWVYHACFGKKNALTPRERTYPTQGLYGQTVLFVRACNALFTSLLLVLIYVYLATFGLPRRCLYYALAAGALGTIMPAYSVVAGSSAASLLVFAGSVLCLRLSTVCKHRAAFAAVAVFIATYGVIIDYANAFFLWPVPGYVGLSAIRNRRLLWAFLPSVMPIAILLIYNRIVLGNFFTLTYTHYVGPAYVPWEGVADSMGLSHVPQGLYGLLLSPSRGLFVLSPVTAFGAAAAVSAVRRRQWNIVPLIAMAVGGILVMSSYALWFGGHCIGYRHILPGAVGLAVLSAFVVERSKGRGWALALTVLAASSFSGICSFFMQARPDLVALSWKTRSDHTQAFYYTELMPRLFMGFTDAPEPTVETAPGILRAKARGRTDVGERGAWISEDATYTVSSVSDGYVPLSGLLDGKGPGVYTEGVSFFFFQTQEEPGAHIVIDLGKRRVVRGIWIGHSRLARPVLMDGRGLSLWLSEDKPTREERGRRVWTNDAAGGSVWSIEVDDVPARYVVVGFAAETVRALQLSGVEIYGE